LWNEPAPGDLTCPYDQGTHRAHGVSAERVVPRQYLPKGTDLSAHTAHDLARIAASLNSRPRKTLGFMTPSEKLAELIAHTG